MPGIKYDMTTFDEVISASTIAFMDKAKKDGKPFFVWMNPTRAHVLTHLSPKYDAMRNPTTDFGLEEAAMKQMDDNIGVVLQWLKDTVSTRIRSLYSRPTMVAKSTLGPMAGPRHSPEPKARSQRGLSGCPA
jgi:hypothetical protein